jgi:hypothetical protein
MVTNHQTDRQTPERRTGPELEQNGKEEEKKIFQ